MLNLISVARHKPFKPSAEHILNVAACSPGLGGGGGDGPIGTEIYATDPGARTKVPGGQLLGVPTKGASVQPSKRGTEPET